MKENEGRFRAELHERFIAPLYALAMGMIAFAALGAPRTTRQNRGAAMAAAVACGVADAVGRIRRLGADGAVSDSGVAAGLCPAARRAASWPRSMPSASRFRALRARPRRLAAA